MRFDLYNHENTLHVNTYDLFWTVWASTLLVIPYNIVVVFFFLSFGAYLHLEKYAIIPFCI